MGVIEILWDGGNHFQTTVQIVQTVQTTVLWKCTRGPNKIYKCIKRMEIATKNWFKSYLFISF